MTRKTILEIKSKLENKLKENIDIDDIGFINYVMMTRSLYQVNKILFSSINERIVIDVKIILETAISYLKEDNSSNG